MQSSEKRQAAIIYACAMLFWFSQYAFASYLNPVMMQRGMSQTFMGLVGSAYGMSQLLLRIPMGILSDRYHAHRQTIVLGCLLALTADVGLYVFKSPVVVLLLRGLGGLGCCSWVCMTVLYSRCFPADQSAGQITRINTGNYNGRLLAYAASSLLVPFVGMEGTFLIGAAGALGALLFSVQIRQEAETGKRQGLRDYLQVLRNRNLLVCSVLGALVQFVAFATEYSFAGNLQVARGASAAQIGTMSIALLVVSVLGNQLSAHLVLKGWPPRGLLITGQGLMALYCVLMPRVTALWQFYPVQMLAGLANSLTIAILIGQCVRTVSTEGRATAMGIFQAVYSLGLTFGPLCMGILSDGIGLNRAFDGMAILSIIGMGMTMAVWQSRRNTSDAGI